jgi:hypothetical protein
LEVEFFRDPDAMVFKGKISCQVSAAVCTQCGFIEIRATDPAQLAGAYRTILESTIAEARTDGRRPLIASCPKCVAAISSQLKCDVCGWAFD